MNNSRSSKFMKVENILGFLLDADSPESAKNSYEEDEEDNSDSNDTNDSVFKEKIHTKSVSNTCLSKHNNTQASQPFKSLTNCPGFQSRAAPVAKQNFITCDSPDENHNASKRGKYESWSEASDEDDDDVPLSKLINKARDTKTTIPVQRKQESEDDDEDDMPLHQLANKQKEIKLNEKRGKFFELSNRLSHNSMAPTTRLQESDQSVSKALRKVAEEPTRLDDAEEDDVPLAMLFKKRRDAKPKFQTYISSEDDNLPLRQLALKAQSHSNSACLKRKFLDLTRKSRAHIRPSILKSIYDLDKDDADWKIQRLLKEQNNFSFVEELTDSENEQMCNKKQTCQLVSRVPESPNINLVKSSGHKMFSEKVSVGVVKMKKSNKENNGLSHHDRVIQNSVNKNYGIINKRKLDCSLNGTNDKNANNPRPAKTYIRSRSYISRLLWPNDYQ